MLGMAGEWCSGRGDSGGSRINRDRGAYGRSSLRKEEGEEGGHGKVVDDDRDEEEKRRKNKTLFLAMTKTLVGWMILFRADFNATKEKKNF
jgi:hypothetical protein